MLERPPATRVAALCLLLAGCVPGHAQPAAGDAGLPVPSAAQAASPGAAPVRDPDLVRRLEEAARAERAAGDRPRTRHLNPDGSARYSNRLLLETSPYLRQHAHNPVDWRPWGDEAFAAARALGRPVFLSVGYSTCHWCHVMEEESFEDEEIAAAINARFIAIKVDREERPAVDALYMSAVQLMNGSGGWPMTLVLTPDREPFFAATYLPPRDGARGGRGTGLLTVLRQLADAWQQEPARAKELAARVVAAIRKEADGADGAGGGQAPQAAAISAAVAQLAARFDAAHGGFGSAPKFPRPVELELLARAASRFGDAHAREMLTKTLDAMAAGGLHDQLGGGFHRYSTDARWRVPHFEEMLYDNAQLVVLYLEAFQLTGEQRFVEVARGVLGWLDREMSAPGGGFASATDADSPGPDGKREEGRFFTWTPAELREALGPARGASAALCFGVTAGGDLEGRSVLHLDERASAAPAVGAPACEALRPELLAARAKRPPPLRDDKVIAAWNGLAISAFARGALVLGAPALAARATRAAEFVLGPMRPGGRLRRSFRAGVPGQPATLDDHAFVIQGLLDLYEATHAPRWLEAALGEQRVLDAHFADPRGGWFLSADDSEALLAREKPAYDGAEPAGNSVAALDALRLAELQSDDALRARGEGALRALAGKLNLAMPALLAALDFSSGQPLEIVLVAPAGGSAAALEEVVRRTFVPNHVLAVASEGEDLTAQRKLVPLLEGKKALGGKATAFVCRGRVCKLPTTDPRVLKAQLQPAPPPPR